MRKTPLALAKATLACVFACAFFAGGSAHADPPTVALPPPVDVCIADGARMTAARVVPSPAGMIDPSRPPPPEHLNWFGPDGRCVTPPPLSRERAACGGYPAPRPVVRRALCQQ